MTGSKIGAFKGADTKREKYGKNFFVKAGIKGGRRRGRGYFGMLKDEGRLDELKNLSRQGLEVLKKKKDAKSQ